MGLVGPVFTREALTAPRRARFYLARGAYVGALFVLMCTAWLVLAGTQLVRNLGDLARFGSEVFQILAPLQLAVLTFVAALSAASAVSLEKDRRTLELLLLSHLTNSELVLGKLLASLIGVLSMGLAALPLFYLLALFGGVSFAQVTQVFAITASSILAAASLGSTLALWREKTFQTLALTALILVLSLGAAEAIHASHLGTHWFGIPCQRVAVALSPWRAVLEASRPAIDVELDQAWTLSAGRLFVISSLVLSALLNGLAVWRVRAWNPSQEVRMVPPEPTGESIWSVSPAAPGATAATTTAAAGPIEPAAISPASVFAGGGRSLADLAQLARSRRQVSPEAAAASAAASSAGRSRAVWDNPILWREIRTWAYGRKVLVIRLMYVVLGALVAAALYRLVQGGGLAERSAVALVLVPLFVVSLLLVNAQAVTSLTSERDAKALDLLLVTDLSPHEFIFGKLGGIFYNTKEMLFIPLGLCAYLLVVRQISLENCGYLIGGLLVMYLFVAMLGVHAGMSYANSRSAIATSLGTVFFLFVGVAVCIRMMIAFSGSFHFQLLPFAALMLGGGIGLFVSLGSRNPSTAIGIASLGCPFATFYAITSSLIEPPQTLGVFLMVGLAYGFTTAAMLIPALYEFDVATGRSTTLEE